MDDIFKGLDLSLLDKLKISEPAKAPAVTKEEPVAQATTEVEEPEIEAEEVTEEVPEEIETEESPIKVWGEILKEKGLIDYTDEEFEDTEDFLASKYEQQVNKGVDTYKESLPPLIKELLDKYEEGVPLDQLIEKESRIMEYSSIPTEAIDEDENLQKSIITRKLTLEGKTQPEIEEELTDLEDGKLLAKQAKRDLKIIIGHEKREKDYLIATKTAEKQKEKADYAAWLTKLDTDIKKRTEIIPGLPLTDLQRKTLYEGITKLDGKGKNAITRMREADPDYDLKVAYLALVHKLDISKIEAKVATKAAKKLADTVTTYKEPSRLKGVDRDVMKNILNRR
jgi:hypothetical protein